MKLLVPIYSKSKGKVEKTYPEVSDGVLFYGSFRTFGGTETDSNGIHTLLDTAKIETWYRPDITAECRVYIESTGEMYEIDGKPENIEMRSMTLLFSVKRVGGKT
jgi:hypothetical protein